MSLMKSFATVGVATLLSRFLGFFRDILLASSLGTGPIADAFVVAFRLPNLFRRLFAEGAFNSAFIPLYSQVLEKEGKKSAKRYAEEILSGLAIVLFILSALIEIFMPLFMLLNAPGFSDTPGKFDITVLYSRVMFPYLFCMSIVAMLSGMMNTLGKFAAAAFAPVLLNIILIIILLLLEYFGLQATVTAGLAISWGVVLAGFAQLALLVWASLKEKIKLDIVRPRWNDNSKQLLKLGIPGIVAGGVTQINIFIGTIIASGIDGAVSYLYFADRIYQLPLGIVGIAIGVVLLPTISRRLSAEDFEGAHRAMDHSFEIAMLLTLPAALALIMIPEQIVSVLFERGALTSQATTQISIALQAFAIGLPAFVLIKVLAPGFFARQDTRTPMIFAVISVVINITASLLLFPHFGHVGIAFATSLAGWINAILLWFVLHRQNYYIVSNMLITKIARMIFAALFMAVSIILFNDFVTQSFIDGDFWVTQFLALFALITVGIVSFFLFANLFGAFKRADLIAAFRPGSA